VRVRAQIARAWAPAVAYMAVIWIASSMQIHDVGIEYVPLADKGVHFLEYGVLGFLGAHAAMRTWPSHAWLRTAALAVLVTVSWGVLDELHQSFVPGRSAEALDIVADLIGALAGAGVRAAAHLVAGRVRRVRAARATADEGAAGAGESQA
jgi:VanZ family protein